MQVCVFVELYSLLGDELLVGCLMFGRFGWLVGIALIMTHFLSKLLDDWL